MAKNQNSSTLPVNNNKSKKNMATTPTTILISLKNPTELPLKMALVVIKQIFRYGVKDISLKGDKIVVQLTYSPRTTTLLRKFGNLPLTYIRTKIDNDEELLLFERVVKKFSFNLQEEDDDEEEATAPPPLGEPKKKRIKPSTFQMGPPPPPPPTIDVTNDSDDDDFFLESQRLF